MTAAVQTTFQTKALEQLISRIEGDLLSYIIIGLSAGALTVAEAEDYGKEILKTTDVKSQDELFSNLHRLGQTHREALAVFLKYAAPYEEEKRQYKLRLAGALIKKGRLDEALAVTKGGNYGK